MNARISDTSHKKITLARLACLCSTGGERPKGTFLQIKIENATSALDIVYMRYIDTAK